MANGNYTASSWRVYKPSKNDKSCADKPPLPEPLATGGVGFAGEANVMCDAGCDCCGSVCKVFDWELGGGDNTLIVVEGKGVVPREFGGGASTGTQPGTDVREIELVIDRLLAAVNTGAGGCASCSRISLPHGNSAGRCS